MNTQKKFHLDCLNFAPVDVSKGFCHLSKELIMADHPACEKFSLLAKCKNCVYYQPEEENKLCGRCGATKENFIAYAEMVARTCLDYQPLNDVD